MADEVSTLLSLFANYSNFYSVLSVLVCFCVMVIFILRLNGEHLMSSSATHYNVVKEQRMVSLHNPFSVQLNKQKTSALKGSVNIDITVSLRCQVYLVWGVNIQAFQRELQAPTTEVLLRYQHNQQFEGEFLHLSQSLEIAASTTAEKVSIEVPDSVTEEGLGQPPRHQYPLIVVSLLSGDQQPSDDAAIVLQYTVFHLKDSMCTLDSHIVYQFVKTNQSSVLSLQPIFISSSEPDIEDSSAATESPTDSNPSSATCENCKGSVESDQTLEDKSSTLSSDTDKHGSIQNITDDKVQNINVDGISAVHVDAGVTDTIATDDSVLDEELFSCIVCQCAQIVYTLLPCRHACVCRSCIKQLDRCPMCRGYIDSFFRLQNVTPDQDEPLEEIPVPGRFFSGGWEGVNNRLNHLLGFQEN